MLINLWATVLPCQAFTDLKRNERFLGVVRDSVTDIKIFYKKITSQSENFIIKKSTMVDKTQKVLTIFRFA